jgi:hypothetical protein
VAWAHLEGGRWGRGRHCKELHGDQRGGGVASRAPLRPRQSSCSATGGGVAGEEVEEAEVSSPACVERSGENTE